MKLYFPFHRGYSPEEFLLQAFTEQWLKDVQEVVRFWLREESFLQAQTSGSTGKPKKIKLPRRLVISSARATLDYLHINEKSDFLLAIPAAFIGGKMLVVRALLGNHDLYLTQPKSVLPALSKKFDLVSITPFQAVKSIGALGSFKQILIGGGAISHSLEQHLQDKKATVYHTYGMTETASHVALKKLNGTGKQNYFEALPGIQFTLDNRGCLVINALAWGIPELVTNDVVKLHSETRFSWLGRADNMVNSGGLKIFPEEIERDLTHQIDKPFFVASLPDKELGEKLILVIQSTSEIDLDFNSIKKLKRPKEVFYLDEFIYTDSAKIDRTKTLGQLKKF